MEEEEEEEAISLSYFVQPEILLTVLTVLIYQYCKVRPTSWSSGQSLWLLNMRSRLRFPALPWEFSLKGKIPTVTMLWVD